MFVEAIKKAKEAMFPFFLRQQVSPIQVSIGVAGTGFFVNSQGHFVTVAYAFDGAGPNIKFVYWGKLPTDLHDPPVDVIEVVRENDLDILIGKIDISNTQYL